MRSKNCLLCGQIIYSPLLEEYEKRENKLAHTIVKKAMNTLRFNKAQAEALAYEILSEMEKIFI